jgi:prepilin-type processing-associated H-X9-DG protein
MHGRDHPRTIVVTRRKSAAFSLLELLVVIGIIAIVVALLLPAIGRARAHAVAVKCQSNMRQIGIAMLIYANDNRGQLFPTDAGGPLNYPPIDRQWFIYVLKPHPPANRFSIDPRDWTPPIMLCPADAEEPENYHSYILNDHLNERGVKYSTRNIPNHTADRVVVMGEKLTSVGDYYIQRIRAQNSDFLTTIDKYRHGAHVGSNYLFLDLHVDHRAPDEVVGAIDPWDIPALGP